jgi:hypothetical protein
MAYAGAGNAGFRHSAWTFDKAGTPRTIIGKIRAMMEKLVQFEPLEADANNFPEIRALDFLDSRLTMEFLDNAGALSEALAAKLLTVDYLEANGTSGVGVAMGPVFPGSVTHTMGRRMGGFTAAQIFEQSGALTYTATA